MSAVWIQGSSGLKMPDTAVILGKGESHSNIYVGSVLHEGKRVLAQVHPTKKAAYYHHHGQDIEMVYYKILCVPNSNWVKFDPNGDVPSNSLIVSLGTEKTYIGRSIVSPSKIYVGTIQPKEGMTVDFYGEPTKMSDCEILITGDVESCVSEEEPHVPQENNGTEDGQMHTENASSVFNYATDDSPVETEIDNDNGLIEYEELEDQAACNEYGNSLELIEERDEIVQ